MELNDLLTRDEDDFFYLDYFDKCQNPELRIFINDEEYIDHMSRMRKLITEGLKTTEPGIYSKYGWMKTKWNRAIEENRRDDIQARFIGGKRQILADYFMSEKTIETAM